MKYHTFPSDQILQIFGQYTLIQTNSYIIVVLDFIFFVQLSTFISFEHLLILAI